MNAVKKLAVVSTVFLAPLAALASTAEEIYLAKAKAQPGEPVPLRVVAPWGFTASQGDTAELVFVVDATGIPTDVAVKSSTDQTLAEAAVDAVKQWKFAPATRDGQPVARKVLLPVIVSDNAPFGTRFAKN